MYKKIFENKTSFLLLSLTTQTKKSLPLIHSIDHKQLICLVALALIGFLCQRSVNLSLWSHHRDGTAITEGVA